MIFRVYQLLICFLPLTAVSQTISVAKPIQKEWHEDKFYRYWSHEFDKAKLSLEDSDETWEWKSSLHYWNLFIAVYDLWPDNPDDLYLIFEDAYRYEPNSFCESYASEFRRFLSYHDSSIVYYRTQIPKMDRLCEKTLAYDTAHIAAVSRIHDRDMMYRGKQLMKPNDPDWVHQHYLDSLNLVEINQIIDSIGYLGRNQVGREYEDVIWLVIIHSNLEDMKRYLPLVKEEISKKNLTAKAYAYIYDRICWQEGRPQLYGTQSIWNESKREYEFYDLADEQEVNKRRYKYQLRNLKGFPKYKPTIDGK